MLLAMDDNRIYQDAWTVLAPRVVSASAELILLLYETVLQPSIYVADTRNHRIVRINNMAGAGWKAFGTFGSGVGQFNEPHGIAVDSRGRIYVADTNNHRLVRIDDMDGNGWVAVGSFGTGLGQFNFPLAVYLDDDERIYVADNGNFRIVMRADLDATPSFQHLGSNVAGVAADPNGRKYATLVTQHRVVFEGGLASLGSFGSGPRQFQFPWGIAWRGGQIYVADWIGNRIARFDNMLGDGWVTLSKTDLNTFARPRGLFVDGRGRIYVAEWGVGRIARVDNMIGTGWVTFGSQGSGMNQFLSPSGIYAR